MVVIGTIHVQLAQDLSPGTVLHNKPTAIKTNSFQLCVSNTMKY